MVELARQCRSPGPRQEKCRLRYPVGCYQCTKQQCLVIPDPETNSVSKCCGPLSPCFQATPGHATDCWRPGSRATSSGSWILFPSGAFGINYLDDDFMLRLADKSHQKGEGTLPQKPETKALHPRATDSGEVTQENSGTLPKAAEVEEEASHHLLHHQKGRGAALPLPQQFL